MQDRKIFPVIAWKLPVVFRYSGNCDIYILNFCITKNQALYSFRSNCDKWFKEIHISQEESDSTEIWDT